MRWSPGFLFFALAIFAKSSSQTECPCGIAEIHFDSNLNAIYVKRVSCSADVGGTTLNFFNNQSTDEYCYGSVSYSNCDTNVHGCNQKGTKNAAYQVTLKYNEVKDSVVKDLAQNKKPNAVKFDSREVVIAFRCIPTDENCKNYYGKDLNLALNNDQIYNALGSKDKVSEDDQKHIQKASDLLKSLTLALPPPRSMSVDANYMEFPMFRTSTTTTTSTTSTTKSTTTPKTTTSLLPKPQELESPTSAAAGAQNQAASGSTKTESEESNSSLIWIVLTVVFGVIALVEGVVLVCWWRKKKTKKDEVDEPRQSRTLSLMSGASSVGTTSSAATSSAAKSSAAKSSAGTVKQSKQKPSRARRSSSTSQGNGNVSDQANAESDGSQMSVTGTVTTGPARANNRPDRSDNRRPDRSDNRRPDRSDNRRPDRSDNRHKKKNKRSKGNKHNKRNEQAQAGTSATGADCCCNPPKQGERRSEGNQPNVHNEEREQEEKPTTDILKILELSGSQKLTSAQKEPSKRVHRPAVAANPPDAPSKDKRKEKNAAEERDSSSGDSKKGKHGNKEGEEGTKSKEINSRNRNYGKVIPRKDRKDKPSKPSR